MSAARAFIALWPDQHTGDRLVALQHALAPALEPFRPRWTHPADLHLTLRFLGDLGHDACERLLTWLDMAMRPPQPLTPAGLERWPDARRARVLVLRLRDVAWLDALAADAEDAASGIGLAPDARPFAPHVTLARLHPADAALLTPVLPPALAFPQLGVHARDPDAADGRRYRALRTRSLAHP